MPHNLTAPPVEEMLAALRDALDVIDCGIVLLAPDMRVRFVNRRFAEIVSIPQVAAVGRSFRDLIGQASADPCCAEPHDEVRAHLEHREAKSGPEQPLPPRSNTTTDGDCCFTVSRAPMGAES